MENGWSNQENTAIRFITWIGNIIVYRLDTRILREVDKTMITELNKESLAIIKQAVKERLEPLESSLGISFSPGAISYGEGGFTIKLQGSLLQCRSGRSGQEVEFTRIARVMGIPTEWYGKEINTSKGIVKIIRIDPKKHTYPIIAEFQDGRMIKLAVDYVKQKLP